MSVAKNANQKIVRQCFEAKKCKILKTPYANLLPTLMPIFCQLLKLASHLAMPNCMPNRCQFFKMAYAKSLPNPMPIFCRFLKLAYAKLAKNGVFCCFERYNILYDSILKSINENLFFSNLP